MFSEPLAISHLIRISGICGRWLLSLRHRLKELTAAAGLLVAFGAAAEAGTITANNGTPGLRNPIVFTNTWWFTPTNGAVINWFTGENNVDGVTFSRRLAGPSPEQKFALNPLGPRTWKGFKNTDSLGKASSESTTSGEGAGYKVPPKMLQPEWNAEWSLTADGHLGTKQGVVNWESTAEGSDPFYAFQEDLDAAGITERVMDLLLNVTLREVTFSALGSFSFHNYMETAAGITDVLTIAGDAAGVTVSGNSSARFYRQPAAGDDPSTLDDIDPLTLLQIQQLLLSDLADRTLDDPLALTIYLPGFRVPLNSLANDARFAAHLDTTTSDADQGLNVNEVPEPSTLFLLAPGLAILRSLGKGRSAKVRAK